MFFIYLSFLVCLLLPGNARQSALTVANPLFLINVKSSVLDGLSSNITKAIDELPYEFYKKSSQRFENSSDECFQSIVKLTIDMENGDRYPLFILDSWGKLESGLLDINLKWLGDYHECTSSEYGSFQGKYCLLSLQNTTHKNAFIPSKLPVMEVGACFPHKCSQKQLLTAFDTVYENISVTCPLQYQFAEWNTVDIATLLICIILMIFVLLSSSVYYYEMNKLQFDNEVVSNDFSKCILKTETAKTVNRTGRLWKVVLSFSLVNNYNHIFSVNSKATEIHCLHGMKFLSVCWVVLGHTALFFFTFSDNMASLLEYIVEHWEFQAVMNGTFCVDSFFFISGLLMAYSFYSRLTNTGGQFSLWKLYLYRYLRLTPLYGFVILFAITLYPKLAEGPLWPGLNNENIELCSKYWYTNLLYINNLYPASVNDECYAIGWYLSNDFQFYLLAPFLIFLLYRKPKIGTAALSLVLLASAILTGVLSAYTEQQPNGEQFGIIAKYGYSMIHGHPTNLTPQYPGPSSNVYMTDLYTKPWFRIGSYVVGLLTGYLLNVTGGKIKMHKAVVFVGWTVAAVTSCSIVYCLYPSFSSGHQLSVNVAALYNAVSRPLWSLSMAWLVVACSSGYGGPVNKILSWKGFVPLSRLTYGVYLLHPLVAWWFIGSVDKLIHFNIQMFILVFVGTLCVTLALSLITALFIELPFIELAKILLMSTPKVTTHSSQTNLLTAEEDNQE